MASITPHKDGFRVQVYVPGKDGSKPLRDSKVLRTKREANAWGKPSIARTKCIHSRRLLVSF